ncbi:MAG: radical SAM protein [Bacteroidales bacterium]|nr:radical SAM protein [Bacteroidales bacterium]
MSENHNEISRKLSTPTQINLEITSACNHKCRFCYNYWRNDPVSELSASKFSIEQMEVIIKKLIDAKVLNVIFSGGEPFYNFEVLLYGVKELTKAGIMTTCNSNLTIPTYEQLKALKDVGLPHILTSLSSYDEETNDKVFGRKGSFKNVTENIKIAVELGIRISINNIINIYNYQHVYETGLLAHKLGASNYFVTRGGTNKLANPEAGKIVILSPDKYIEVLDAAVRVRNETGINIYSLYQYPLCLIKDLEKYKEFVGRGCPAGKKLININVDGEMHACNHEVNSYGNIFTTDVKSAWDKMEKWRDMSLIPEDCKNCKWYEWCEAGCRQAADDIKHYDYLYQGTEVIKDLDDPKPVYLDYLELVKPGIDFEVNTNLRFRKEDNFYLIHIIGGWLMSVDNDVSEFLQTRSKNGNCFQSADFPADKNLLATLLAKNIVNIK